MSINGSHTRINTLGRLTRAESGPDLTGRYDMMMNNQMMNNHHKMVGGVGGGGGGGGGGMQKMYYTQQSYSENTGDSYGQTGTMSRRPNTVQDMLQNISASLTRAEMIVQHELQYGDGGTLARNRDLDECFGVAGEQMELVDGLIREMRSMGQPCDTYHRRFIQLNDQMRAIEKAAHGPRLRKGSKGGGGGGGFSSQSGSGWDEYTKRTTTETLNQIRQQKGI